MVYAVVIDTLFLGAILIPLAGRAARIRYFFEDGQFLSGSSQFDR